MNYIVIPNGAHVYAALVEAGNRVELVIEHPHGPVVLRAGLTTLGALDEVITKMLAQARAIADDRAGSERDRCLQVASSGRHA